MGRAPCCEKIGLNRGRWTAQEDEILVKYIAANGEGSLRSLPKNAGLLRCGKSCRLRWINYLRPGLKRGNITKEEDEIIINLHAAHGNKWSLIAGHLPGRTDNEIKNYWNSHLSRRVHNIKGSSGGGEGEAKAGDHRKNRPGGGKRTGGRSRSSLTKIGNRTQKNKRTNVKIPSVVQAEEDHRMALDPDQNLVGSSPSRQQNKVVMHTGSEGMQTVLQCPRPVESRLWATSTEKESMFFRASEESSLEWESLEERIEEREGGRMEVGVVRPGEEVGFNWELDWLEAEL